MFLQQLSTLPAAFSGIGLHFLIVFAVSLGAGMIYTAFRDFMPRGRKLPAPCKATTRARDK